MIPRRAQVPAPAALQVTLLAELRARGFEGSLCPTYADRPVLSTVRGRGLEGTCTSLPEALDRRDQLDARGIEVELLEVAGGQRRKIG